jgi:hypothetical protein
MRGSIIIARYAIGFYHLCKNNTLLYLGIPHANTNDEKNARLLKGVLFSFASEPEI